MICSWNTRKESFVENQEGEFDRPNAGPEKNNDGELKPQKMIQLVSEIWRNQELLISGLIDHMELVYARRRIGTQNTHCDQDNQSENNTGIFGRQRSKNLCSGGGP